MPPSHVWISVLHQLLSWHLFIHQDCWTCSHQTWRHMHIFPPADLKFRCRSTAQNSYVSSCVEKHSLRSTTPIVTFMDPQRISANHVLSKPNILKITACHVLEIEPNNWHAICTWSINPSHIDQFSSFTCSAFFCLLDSLACSARFLLASFCSSVSGAFHFLHGWPRGKNQTAFAESKAQLLHDFKKQFWQTLISKGHTLLAQARHSSLCLPLCRWHSVWTRHPSSPWSHICANNWKTNTWIEI